MLKSTQKAFTLIELLVVIAIIGLLASIVLIALNSARAKSRDAARKQDLQELAAALELYYDDNGAYPPAAEADNYDDCTTADIGNGYSLTELLVPAYVAKVPSDPKYPGSVTYGQCLMYTASQATTGSSGYRLYAHLENPSAQDLSTMNSSDPTDAWAASFGGDNYKYVQVGS